MNQLSDKHLLLVSAVLVAGGLFYLGSNIGDLVKTAERVTGSPLARIAGIGA